MDFVVGRRAAHQDAQTGYPRGVDCWRKEHAKPKPRAGGPLTRPHRQATPEGGLLAQGACQTVTRHTSGEDEWSLM